MVLAAILLFSACTDLPTTESTEPSGSEASSTPDAANKSTGEISTDSGAPKVSAATITKIVDGDTAHVSLAGGGLEKVRFIGMDTPERGKPYFSEATSYAASHLANKQVYLEVDVEERDRYGRLLAYVWLSPPKSGSQQELRSKMFNAKALLDGYAAILTVPPNVKYVDMFRSFQTEARDANRGLWGLETQAAPSGCDPSYPDHCIAPAPPDLDCGEISHRRFRVLQPDPHGFDGRDQDGIGCES